MGTICKQFQHINHEEDSEEEIERKLFYNRIIADKKPYFFRYKYKALAKEYNDYKKKTEENAVIHFSKTLEDLIKIQKESPKDLTDAERTFLMYYHKFLPVIDSECVMNKVCKYIESIDFEIKKKVRNKDSFDYTTLMSEDFKMNKVLFLEIKDIVEDFLSLRNETLKKEKRRAINYNDSRDGKQKKNDKELEYAYLREKLDEVCSDGDALANYLVYLFYQERPSLSKSILWNLVGMEIYNNIRKKTSSFLFPIKDSDGDIEFLYEKYKVKAITLKESKSNKEIKEIKEIKEREDIVND